MFFLLEMSAIIIPWVSSLYDMFPNAGYLVLGDFYEIELCAQEVR